MPKRKKRIISETDLYQPIYDYLVAQGYTVRSEVRNCDIAAIKDDDLIIIELKRQFSTDLLIQATKRQRITDSVYVAIPKPTGKFNRTSWRGKLHLLHRLEIGLILVSFSRKIPVVNVAFHPLPFERKHSQQSCRAI